MPQSIAARSFRRFAAPLFLTVLLTACGGGGGTPPDTDDTKPEAFTFTAIDDVAPDLAYLSEPVTIQGIDSPTAIAISGENCRYAIGDGKFTADKGTVRNGQAVTVRARAATGFETAAACTLDAGGVTGTFTVTTGANAFSFDIQPGRLALAWDGFAGVSRYELTRHNSATGESEFIADAIPGNADGHDAALSAHLTDWINDRFVLSACNASGCVTIPEHEVTLVQALSAQAITYIKASNTEDGDFFGFSVALDGDTLAVGAYDEDSAAIGINGNQDDNAAESSGAVYVFRRNDSTWEQEAYLKASNTGEFDQFGSSVALDGDTLVVGASVEDSGATGVNGNQDDNTGLNSGAVYVFRRDNTQWAQEAYLKASNTDDGDFFGISVALDGDTLAVGARGEDSAATGMNGNQDDDAAKNSGAVYVFQRNGTAWAQEAYIKASNTGFADLFGISVALDGDTLAVGATLEDSRATGVNGDQGDNTAEASGAVYVFRRDSTTWTQEAYLKASNTGEFDQFGSSVALDGDTLAVGATLEDSRATGVNGNQDDNTATDSGAVYVFRRDNATWIQEAYVKAFNTGAGDRFGYHVARDGDLLAIGALEESSSATGIDGTQAHDCDAAQPENCTESSGAVYLFQHNGTTWTRKAYVKASNTGLEHEFGSAVALSDGTLAVGAPLEDSAATDVNGNPADDCDTDGEPANCARESGAVYVY